MKELRSAIKRELNKVTSINAPGIYRSIQTADSYRITEDMIINIMIDEDMTASEAIPHLEMTL